MTDGVGWVTQWLRACAHEFESRAEELNSLDRVLADGDHGTNMLRGFAVAECLDLSEVNTGAEALRQVGMALVANVGGASGPLFGTYFLRLGSNWPSPATTAGVAVAVREALAGVVARGRAEVGDKTMVDAIAPAAESLERSAQQGEDLATAMEKAAAEAAAGCGATAAMAARRGRAYLRAADSVGVLDPGAVSMSIIFRVSTLQAA